MSADTTSRRRIVPEVVQTSAMDCGPASLKCLLEGFGIPVSYGRLREACQTDVDGTSINSLEAVAVQLGLEAEQVMLPVDHLLLPEAQALPAILVVRQANDLTHFVILWSRHGRFVQVMDPAVGRRWLTTSSCSRHSTSTWTRCRLPPGEWVSTEEFLGALRRRLGQLRLSRSAKDRLVEAVLADPSWHACAALDAATRIVDTLVRAGGLRPGRQAAHVLAAFSSSRAKRRWANARPFRKAIGRLTQPHLDPTAKNNSSCRVRCSYAYVGDACKTGLAQPTRHPAAPTDRLPLPRTPGGPRRAAEPARPRALGPPTDRRPAQASSAARCPWPRSRWCCDRSPAVSRVLRPEPGFGTARTALWRHGAAAHPARRATRPQPRHRGGVLAPRAPPGARLRIAFLQKIPASAIAISKVG